MRLLGGRLGRRWVAAAVGMAALAGLLRIGAVPWTTYAACGMSVPMSLPRTVRIGLYEEFPSSSRLDKLRQMDFPVSLAIAASSREQFLQLRDAVRRAYPQVRDVLFWPLLTPDEGYYPGAWSNATAVQRAARETDGLPVLWDLELPRDPARPSPRDWWRNRMFLDAWLRQRTEPTHIWRSSTALGLDSTLLQLSAFQFDPLRYRKVSMHLDLYATGDGLPDPLLRRVLRCGVERYGDRFIPSFGVLNDGQAAPDVFVPAATLQRYLRAARQAGVGEVWLFGANGLTGDVVRTLRATLPVGS
jgi:hypothetical protein